LEGFFMSMPWIQFYLKIVLFYSKGLF